MNEKMINTTENIESIKGSIIKSNLPNTPMTFEEAILEGSMRESAELIANDSKYQNYIENPENAGFFTEQIIKMKRGNADYYKGLINEKLIESSQQVNLDQIDSLSHEEKTAIARASVTVEKEIRKSVTSEDIRVCIEQNLFDSRVKFYHNYLWRFY